MKANDTSVLDFISGRQKAFIIPPFQRNYEWTTAQCKELFCDIENAYFQNKTHYLGNIVYYVGKNSGASFQEFILIDGQQRLTTILLLLCALRDCGQEIDENYLINQKADEKFRIRLKQTSYDYQNFCDVVEGRKLNGEQNGITQNYRYFLKLIRESELTAKEIYDSIEKLAIVEVNLQIDDDLEAVQTIFEKINSTGKPLYAADLIRNFLLISNSSFEQEKLYNGYWVKIETLVGNEDISRFSRDYLVLKTCADVEKDLIYTKFKKYFSDSSMSHEDILSEMLSYAKVYSWLVHGNCPDTVLARCIEELCILQSDDVFCLYMYLMSELYETNLNELRLIFRLLADFLLRYRIVTPSGGGGSLRLVIHQILDKLMNGEIEMNYASVLFELSNSSSRTGRFPDDEEFKTALLTSRKANYRYGRVLFNRIEENGKKYIPIEYSKTTIEHLIPQTLTKWWEEKLGGKEKSVVVYEKCINAIGNLAPMSLGGNSANKNKPWQEKLKQIEECQFQVTSNVAKYTEWGEEQVVQRGNELAEAACKCVIAPLVRTRQTLAISVSAGFYPLSDIDTNMNNATISKLRRGETEFSVTSWNGLFNTVCKIAFDENAEFFAKLVDENTVHKAKHEKDGKQYAPFISRNPKLLTGAKKISDSPFYSEAVLSNISARKVSKQLLDLYAITEEFEILIGENSDDETE